MEPSAFQGETAAALDRGTPKRQTSNPADVMPYRSNMELPPSVQNHLPAEAQTIYRESFNRAWKSYENDPRQEEIAHRVAWAAVKRRYRKLGDAWVLKREAAARHC
jgi:cation transport regulator